MGLKKYKYTKYIFITQIKLSLWFWFNLWFWEFNFRRILHWCCCWCDYWRLFFCKIYHINYFFKKSKISFFEIFGVSDSAIIRKIFSFTKFSSIFFSFSSPSSLIVVFKSVIDFVKLSIELVTSSTFFLVFWSILIGNSLFSFNFSINYNFFIVPFI